MKPRQLPWKWLLIGAGALLIIGLAVFPRLVGNSGRLTDRVTQALAAWTGGEVKLVGPLRVHYFPDVSIKGGFELSNASRLPLLQSVTAKDAKITLDLADLLRGVICIDALRLTHAEITLKGTTSSAPSAAEPPQTVIANLLGGAPVGILRLRDGTIKLPTAAGVEVITKVDARFDASSGSGAMSSFGSFLLMNETVRFALDSGAPSDAANGSSVPVSLTLTSTPISARISGTASFANGLQMDGDVQAGIPNAREFLRWAGIPLPTGQSLKELTANGSAHWNGVTLTFDDGSFILDGNSAVGLLAITPGARPRVEGTLAFDRLSIDPYLGDGKIADAAAAAVPPSNQALLKYLDADLRVSAGEIAATAIKLGRGGFTISAKDGVLAGEIGELELCGGSASGRFGIDMSQPTAKASLVGNVSGMTIDGCLQQPVLGVPFKGTGGLKAEISTYGSDYDELVHGLSGTLRVDAQNGAVPVDFPRLLTSVAPLDGEGWSRNNQTLFDSLSADCRLGSGHIWCQMFSMQTRRGLISGSGAVDLARQTLDWNLFVATRTTPLKASQLSTDAPPRVSIRGSLLQPMIRRADRPTLGGGSSETSPMATQVSPR
jgi:AsmA protein